MVIMMVSKEKVLRKEKKVLEREKKKGAGKRKKIKKTALFVYVSNKICKILPAFVLPAL